MGLDWISSINMRQKDREDYIRRNHATELLLGQDMDRLIEDYAPKTTKPCRIVGAPKVKDLPDFETKARQYLESRQDHARKEMTADPKFRNQSFIDYWLKRTLEEQMADDAEKFCCDECPLLKALQGADSQDSVFLGVTVASCDFRGKRIGADGELGDLADEAYRDHDPDEMLDYAARLEQKLEELRERGKLQKDPYSKYVKEYKADPWAKMTGQQMLTKAEYDQTLHWREQNIRDAVHWLRTCASYGASMEASY